jgi:predicted nucleic acid-binding protein
LGGLIEKLGERVYLDTNFFIYTLEAVEPWVRVARRVLAALDEGACSGVTSELSLAECLVKPLQLGQAEVVQTYQAFLQERRFLSVVPITRELLAEAARLRAISRIKLPDAIHAATALQRGCTSFLTNDDRLTIPGIKLLGWDDLSKEPT